MRGGAGWIALAVFGLVFWFVLGFPFGHHNESYDWAAWIDVADPSGVTWRPFFGSMGYRPLAMTTAWASYRWSDGSLVPIQLVNALVTILAWVILARAVPKRRSFAVAALAAVGVLFSGYIYLFHLHGVFYGPMLLWLAVALAFCFGRPTPRGYLAVAVLSLVAGAFHPYALVFCLAFTVVAPLEFGWLKDKWALALVGLLAGAGAALIVFATPESLATEVDVKLAGLVTSFRALEVARPVSAVAAACAIATVWTTHWPGPWRARLAIAAAGVVSVSALATGVPLVLVWLAAAFDKAMVHRRWTLAALLLVSLGLPFAGATGSPTYAVFAVALAAVALAIDADPFEHALERVPAFVPWAAVLAMLVLAGALRAGASVPIVSKLVQPVLAERERTHQLERLLTRILASPSRTSPVLLADAAAAPVASAGAIDRSRRSPTQQVCLDAYLTHERGEPDSSVRPIVISFGETEPARESDRTVPSRHAGWAVAALDTSRARSTAPAQEP